MPRLYLRIALLVILFGCAVHEAEPAEGPKGYLTTAYPVTLLCGNDGEMRFLHGGTGMRQEPVRDSITVIEMGSDHPPRTRTVAGTVPVTIYGSPRLAMTADGRYGFVSNHKMRTPELPDGKPVTIPPEQLVNVLTAIDLASNDLKVVDQVRLPAAPLMVASHPDGMQVIVAVGAAFRIYAVENSRLALKAEAKSPALVDSFDVSPRGDLILATTADSTDSKSKRQLHLFTLSGNTIAHRQRIEALPGVKAPMERLFSPRISPDGKTALVPQDNGEGGKGTLDDVLVVDLDRDIAAVTGLVPQVGDGPESVAFHPSGRFAVVACVEVGLDITQSSHLAVIDLTASPPRLLSHIPVGLIPEGMEFTADGSQLFVGLTAAHHIAMFEVDGFALRRSPCVLRTGHGPVALGLGVRKSRFISNGIPIAYIDTGKGEPVVLLHGATGSLDGYLGDPLYKDLLDARFRIIALDCRGHGQSGKPHDVKSYGPEMADDVARLLDHLGIQRAHVVGYSMGGDIANKLRERHPHRLLSVIMGGVGGSPEKGWTANPDYDVTRLAAALERGEGMVQFFLQPLTLGQPPLSKDQAKEINLWFRRANDPLAIAAMARSMPDLTVSAESLRTNAVPTLVAVGQNDPERLEVDALKSVMKSAEFLEIAGADHVSAGRHSQYRKRVLEFLQRHNGK